MRLLWRLFQKCYMATYGPCLLRLFLNVPGLLVLEDNGEKDVLLVAWKLGNPSGRP